MGHRTVTPQYIPKELPGPRSYGYETYLGRLLHFMASAAVPLIKASTRSYRRQSGPTRKLDPDMHSRIRGTFVRSHGPSENLRVIVQNPFPREWEHFQAKSVYESRQVLGTAREQRIMGPRLDWKGFIAAGAGYARACAPLDDRVADDERRRNDRRPRRSVDDGGRSRIHRCLPATPVGQREVELTTSGCQS